MVVGVFPWIDYIIHHLNGYVNTIYMVFDYIIIYTTINHYYGVLYTITMVLDITIIMVLYYLHHK